MPPVDLARVAKVVCYVIRDGHLLVFLHRDYPVGGESAASSAWPAI